jgi:hypothetical protein
MPVRESEEAFPSERIELVETCLRIKDEVKLLREAWTPKHQLANAWYE